MNRHIIRAIRNFHSLRKCSMEDIRPVTKFNHFSRLPNRLELIRNYKDFGHAEQKEPLGKILWVLFLTFGFFGGAVSCLFIEYDIYEEGEAKYHPEKDIYRSEY